MRLHQLGLRPATLARLHRGGINTTYRLLEHTCRELIWHSELGAQELYEIIRVLERHGWILAPAPKGTVRKPGERNLEVLRLRAIEGLSLDEVGQQVGIGPERVRQVLAAYFGLRGSPPAVKARHKQ
jgi:hypothetical protein